MTKQDAYPPAERSRALFAYILDLSVNVGVTGAIVGKLWYRGRRTPALVPFSDSSDLAITNRYIGPIAVLLESGAIAAAMQLTDLIVLVVNQPLIVVTIWFSAQLSVSRPNLLHTEVLTNFMQATVPMIVIILAGMRDGAPTSSYDARSRSSSIRFWRPSPNRIGVMIGSTVPTSETTFGVTLPSSAVGRL